MSRNNAQDFAARLYGRVPAHYRVYDAEQGLPLLALLTVVGEQVAGVRQDVDTLWDNFFIESCEDWVVPYLGALVGARLLAQPVEQSNRLDVYNTVVWRRSKGTPQMLRNLGQAISGWESDLAELFQNLGWSQHMNHLRGERPLTPDLRDALRLSRLGRADDPWAHAADFKPAAPLDQARVGRDSLGVGKLAWGAPGRYAIKNLGLFVRRLQTFALRGVTPAAAVPGAPPPADAACFSFDPLFRDAPLFVEQSGAPLGRVAFDQAPWPAFGRDVGVRYDGVLLAAEANSAPVTSASRSAFSFGGAGAGLRLRAGDGLRLMEPRSFAGGPHFVIEAIWQGPGRTRLGAVSTLHAAAGDPGAFLPGDPAGEGGQLALEVLPGFAGLGWPGTPTSPGGRFPGAVLAVRRERAGAQRQADALLVYLPPAVVEPGERLAFAIADDGSSYRDAALSPPALARPSEGQVYPPRALSSSAAPATITLLNRKAGGLRIADPSRFGAATDRAAALIEAELFTGAFQLLGAVATADQAAADHPDLELPAAIWPALTYAPSGPAVRDELPDAGLLCVRVRPLAGDVLPACELIVGGRNGEGLLVYLPEIEPVAAEGARLFVAADGSSYFVPTDAAGLSAVAQARSLAGLPLARAGAGQALPIPGAWPLRQRRPVGLNLCRCERAALLHDGELGIDPELGRFALAPADPLRGAPAEGDRPAWPAGLSVDYVEGFSDRVGARTFDRQLDPRDLPTRLVARSGDGRSALSPGLPPERIHGSLAAALAAAADGELIEILDSATYLEAAPAALTNAAVRRLTIRAAAGQRPCLAFYAGPGAPAAASLRFTQPLDSLTLDGLLVSGGPLELLGQLGRVLLRACTLDPLTAQAAGSLLLADDNRDHQAAVLLCRCISGPVRAGAGVAALTIADSIVDGQAGPAIGGPGVAPLAPPGSAERPARELQLERATVRGRIRCEVLHASESLLCDRVVVDDQQAGCVRFSRYERGSVLPRRFRCVPRDDEPCPLPDSCLEPVFNSRRFGRPDYMQLAAVCPPAILAASEAGAEAGAFASRLNTIRRVNTEIKLREFLPVGLRPLIIAET